MRELRHWPSIAGMSPQSHCGDEEDVRIALSSWLHYTIFNECIYDLCLVHVQDTVGSSTSNA